MAVAGVLRELRSSKRGRVIRKEIMRREMTAATAVWLKMELIR